MKSGNGLRKDICNLQEPGKLADEIDKAIIARCIPSDLNYACHYWVYHLQRSRQHITDELAILSDGGVVHKFLQEHLLHWLEVLSLKRRLSAGVTTAQQLISLVPVSIACENRRHRLTNIGAYRK